MNRVEFERGRLVRIIDRLNLERGQWALCGSGVMLMHRIDRGRAMGDVDIFVATRQWMEMVHGSIVGTGLDWKVFTTDPSDPRRRCDPPYLYRHIDGIEVNVFFEWRKRGIGDIDVNDMIRNAEMVDGVPCAPLDFLLRWKEEVGREKDTSDIMLLRSHLANQR